MRLDPSRIWDAKLTVPDATLSTTDTTRSATDTTLSAMDTHASLDLSERPRLIDVGYVVSPKRNAF